MDIKRVIFILTDTVRASSIGLYGKRPSPTPSIDRLKQNGWVFLNTYAAATSTDPSVTSIMSGNFPLTNGLINHGKHIKKEEEVNISNITLLPELLKKNGFHTAAIDWLGRWHKRGYDYYSGNLSHDFESKISVAYKFPFPFLFRILDKIFVKLLRREFFIRAYYAFHPRPKFPYDRANLIVDKAFKILNAKQKEKLFLYLHFWDAHVPHTRPKGIKSYLLDDVEDTYLSEINFLDQQLGRLFNFLDTKNLLKDTLIVFTADHGEDFGEHGMPFNHENLYEDVVKVPLIFYHTGFKPRLSSKLTQHVDIFPTILSLLNISVPINTDGQSLIFQNQKPRSFVYFEDITHRKLKLMAAYRRKGIFNGSLKYIKTYSGKEENLGRIMTPGKTKITRLELYNLKKDPQEKNNLIYSQQNQSRRMDDILTSHIQSLNLKRFKRHFNSYEKLKKSKQVIEKAFRKYKTSELAIAWKGGKDTTVMMHIIKSIYGEIPCRIFFNDTTLEFKATYDFISLIKKLWNLDLITVKHSDKELAEYHNSKDVQRKKELTRLMKISAIHTALKKYKFKGFMLGIRKDENPARARETYFSKRPDHIRIHPLLEWTEKDVWEYILNFGVPYNDLYSKGYRSIGEKGYTFRVAEGESERAGRDQEKEKLMIKLRRLGYW